MPRFHWQDIPTKSAPENVVRETNNRMGALRSFLQGIVRIGEGYRISNFIEHPEIDNPAAPTSGVRVYSALNGADVEYRARFPNGTVEVLSPASALSIAASQVTAGTFQDGLYVFSRSSDEILRLVQSSATGNPFISFYQSGSQRAFIQFVDSGPFLRFRNSENGQYRFEDIGGSTLMEIQDAAPVLNLVANFDEMLRLSHGLTTGSPFISFYQSGTRKGLIQHDDSFPAMKLLSDEGPWVIQGEGDETLRIRRDSATGSPYISFYQQSTRRAYIQYNNSGNIEHVHENSGSFRFSSAGSGIFQIRDTGGSGTAANPYVSFYDSGSTRLGYIGFGSTSTSDIFVNSDSASVILQAQGTKRVVFNGTTLTVEGDLVATVIKGSTTWDIPSTANGAGQVTTLTVTGASVGDSVIVDRPSVLQNLDLLYAVVSSADTVRLIYLNLTGGTRDPASATFRVHVFHQ